MFREWQWLTVYLLPKQWSDTHAVWTNITLYSHTQKDLSQHITFCALKYICVCSICTFITWVSVWPSP